MNLFHVLFLGASAKLCKGTVSLTMSLFLHGTCLLPLNGFSGNLMFEYFSKSQEYSGLIKV
jgi:hypothetical protein